MSYDMFTQELKKILNLKSPKIEQEARFQAGNQSVIVDLVLDSRTTTYFVEIKRKLNLDTVSHFFAAMDMISNSVLNKKEQEFIIVTQIADPVAMRMAERLGIRIEKLPISFSIVVDEKATRPSKIKLTSDKAWSPIMSLLKHQPTTIYNVHMKSKVSYGQAHRIVSYLKGRDLIMQDGNFVAITNFKPILNAVFWERPLSSLVFKTYHIDLKFADDQLSELSNIFKGYKIKHALTGLHAYEKCFHGIRTNTPFKFYVDVSNSEYIKDIEQFTSGNDNTPNLVIYKPDRDVFSETQIVDEIEIVSKEQLLLDLSGGDKIEVQLAAEMVKQIGKI